MLCCCSGGRVDDADGDEHLGSKILAKDGRENGTQAGERRYSADSDVFFDAEEDFYIDGAGGKDPVTAPARLSVGSVASDATTVSSGPPPRPGEKTKETLALEKVRAAFAEYDLPDQTYCRYLRARHWDVNKAIPLIQNYLDWRAEMKPESIKWTDIAEEFETGKVFRLGLMDFKKRHVVILRPGMQNTKNHSQQMKQLVYTMESAIAMKPKESRDRMEVAPVRTPAYEQLIVLLDFTGYTLRNAPPFKTSLETLKILQDYYCERLGEALLLNPPGVFRFLWKLIRPFIDKRTLKKINFLPRNFKECDLLKERFDLNELDASLGGTGNLPFDFKKYGELMMGEDAERERAMAGKAAPEPQGGQ